jgi:hypothetical protein
MKHQLSKTVRFICVSVASILYASRDLLCHILNPNILHVMVTSSLVIDSWCASRRHIQPVLFSPGSCVLVVRMRRTYLRCAGNRGTCTQSTSQRRGNTSLWC